MPGPRTTWEEIKRLYDQEWVELIGYDWPEEEPYPRSGIVRVHAKTRQEFDDLADNDPPADSACLYVGERPKHNYDVIIRGYRRIIVG